MSRRECLADRIMWRADATMHVEADCDWPWRRLKRRDSRLILIHFLKDRNSYPLIGDAVTITLIERRAENVKAPQIGRAHV